MSFLNFRDFRNTGLTRAISTVIVIAFMTTNVAFAAPDGINANTQAPSSQQETITDPDKIVIPKDTGILKSKFKGSPDRLIIHIQDAHCNYEAQTNIAKLIESFVKNDGLKLVSVEGADGVVDTSWFKAFPDEEIRKEVATYFMKKGEITGPEYLSITTDLPIKLFGAETREYYIQNLNAFTSSYPLKAETEKYYNQIKGALNRLKGYIYNNGLKDMDSKMEDYESKKIQFNDYIRFLQDSCEKHKINIRAYDDLFKLVSVLIYEKKINFNVVDKERGAVIDLLTKRMSKDQIAKLVAQSLAFKVGKISSVEFYAYLKALAQSNEIDLAKDYPNLFNYMIYNAVYSRIENEKLFHEIKLVETAIKEKLFQNDDQRTLEKLSRHVDTLLGLINIKLLNGDYEYYKTHKEEFAPQVFADFIKSKSVQYGFSYELDPPTEAVATSIPKLDDFYSIAIKRDRALVDNTLVAMTKDNTRIAVLVTGGFHSEGISKLLEKQGVSYIVICPNITKNEPSPYIQILTNQRTSFEDLLTDTGATKATMLAPFSIAEAIGMSEEELAKTSNAIEGVGPLAERAKNVEANWIRMHVSIWLSRAMAYAGQHKLARDKHVMKEAYRIALSDAVAKMVANGLILAGQGESIKSNILNSDKLNEAFDRIETWAAASLRPVPVTVAEEGAVDVKTLDALAQRFSWSPYDTEYFKIMQRRIKDAIDKKGLDPLSIITEQGVIDSILSDQTANLKPDEIQGNYILAEALDDTQKKDKTGTIPYSALKTREDLKALAKNAVVVLDSLDGGIGENVGRALFKQWLFDRKLVITPVLGAKGTDFGFEIRDVAGNVEYVTIAEIKLMQIVLMKRTGLFKGLLFEPLVNAESSKSYSELLNSECIEDRINDPANPRTYAQFLESEGIDVLPFVLAPDYPGFDAATGEYRVGDEDNIPATHGNHGNGAFNMTYQAYKTRQGTTENPIIRVFYNGDNLNSRASAYIIGDMMQNRKPVVKIVTRATPIDMKGGKDGLRVVFVKDEQGQYVRDDKGNYKIHLIPDQMEVKDAQNAEKSGKKGQLDAFYKAGQGAGKNQPFNTNIFFINVTLIHDILNALVERGVISEEDLKKIISPSLIENIKDGKVFTADKFRMIEGAFGTAMHNLNSYFKESPQAQQVLDEILGVENASLLHFVDVERDEFFTPIKKTTDPWFIFYSGYYRIPSTEEELAAAEYSIKALSALPPPELELSSKNGELKDDYWTDEMQFIESLGERSDARELASLRVRGKVHMPDAVLKGSIFIVNTTGKMADLGGLMPGNVVNGKLMLGKGHNDTTSIVIYSDDNGDVRAGKLDVSRLENLEINGDVNFSPETVFEGKVNIANRTGRVVDLPKLMPSAVDNSGKFTLKDVSVIVYPDAAGQVKVKENPVVASVNIATAPSPAGTSQVVSVGQAQATTTTAGPTVGAKINFSDWEYSANDNMFNTKKGAKVAMKANLTDDGNFAVEVVPPRERPGDAITMTGEALTPEQHARVNGIIANAFTTWNDDDKPVLVLTIGQGADAVQVYVIPGLVTEDSYLVSHAGLGGELLDHQLRRVYVSPTRLDWVKNTLSPAAQAQFWAHEAGHSAMRLSNPNVTEAEVQAAYPIDLVLKEAAGVWKQAEEETVVKPALVATEVAEAGFVAAVPVNVAAVIKRHFADVDESLKLSMGYDYAGLSSLLQSLGITAESQDKKLILAFDTALDPNNRDVLTGAVRSVETKVNKYLRGALIEVRGTGKALAERVEEEANALKGKANYIVVTIAGDRTISEVDKQNIPVLGKVINLGIKEESGKITPVPVMALYEFALRLAFDQDLSRLRMCLERIMDEEMNKLNGGLSYDEIINSLVNNEHKIVRILPRIAPINFNAAREAYKAAQAAAMSL